MRDPLHAPIEVESLGVGVYVHGEVWRLVAAHGRRRGRSARAVLGRSSPAGRLYLETLFLLAGCIRLALAVLLVYGSPLELY